jgi:cell division protease FtsH
VRRIVESTFDRAVTLLTERRDLLESTARRLLEKETLNEAELKVLTGTASGATTAETVAG